jgi:hypothetical protein
VGFEHIPVVPGSSSSLPHYHRHSLRNKYEEDCELCKKEIENEIHTEEKKHTNKYGKETNKETNIYVRLSYMASVREITSAAFGGG